MLQDSVVGGGGGGGGGGLNGVYTRPIWTHHCIKLAV